MCLGRIRRGTRNLDHGAPGTSLHVECAATKVTSSGAFEARTCGKKDADAEAEAGAASEAAYGVFYLPR